MLTAFAVTPVALLIIPKVEFNFEVVYITIFASQVQKRALNLQSVIITYLKHRLPKLKLRGETVLESALIFMFTW